MAIRKSPGGARKSKASAKKAGRKPQKSAKSKVAVKKKSATKTSARKSARKTATKKAAVKKTSPKSSNPRTTTKVPARKAAAKKPAATKKKTRPKAAAEKTKAKALSKPSRKTRPDDRSAAAASAPPRKSMRRAARRNPPHHAATPRDKPARNVSVRTAIVNDTSGRPRSSPRASRAALLELVRVSAPDIERQAEILSADALAFFAALHRQFDGHRISLLARRHERQARFDAGELPDFLRETRHIREGGWAVTELPPEFADRRVEVIGPPDRKMMVDGLNSGARVFIADFEDATSPTWRNLIEGQINLLDRWRGKLSHSDPVTKRRRDLCEKPALLMVRPRGWHLPEAHMSVDGEELSAALFDFGLAAFHSGRLQVEQGAPPAFYLPKLENHLEARLWNDVLAFTERYLDLPRGTFKVTVLIETLPAAFEMDEIIFELREHIVGLACGRGDYIFSFIKRLGAQERFLTPDRREMVMDEAFLEAYSTLLVKTCHRRGILALGGIASQNPVRGGAKATQDAYLGLRTEKEREARIGHDGTWVAHPDLVPLAMEVFDGAMPQLNQLDVLRPDVGPNRDALLTVHEGRRTLAGLREAVSVGLEYLAAWLSGRGTVPINDLIETIATAETCRAQVWQWVHHGARLSDGTLVTAGLVAGIIGSESARLKSDPFVAEAARLFEELVTAQTCEEHLTLPAYRQLDDIRA